MAMMFMIVWGSSCVNGCDFDCFEVIEIADGVGGRRLHSKRVAAKHVCAVILDRPWKWIKNRRRGAPYSESSPDVQQTTLPPVLYHLPIILRPHLSLHHTYKRY